MSVLAETVIVEEPRPELDPIPAVPANGQKRNPIRGLISQWWVLLPLAVLALWALAPGLFTTQDPIDGVPLDKFQAPSIQHLFGTDHLGRDVFTRVVYGTSQTFLTAGIAAVIGCVAGVSLGLAASTLGRFADTVAMRVVDVILSVPGFLISLIIVAATEPGPLSLGIGVGIASIAIFARLVRTEVLRVRSNDYINAALMSGGSYFTVMRTHILPHVIGPVLALLAVDLGGAILAISGLGFLGFGSPPPTPEWGLLIAEGRQYIAVAWWLTTLPGLVIIVTVILLAALGRSINKTFRF